MNYARKKCFDPLIPDKWYHQVKRSVVAEEVNTKTKRKEHKGERRKFINIVSNTTLGREDSARLIRPET